MLKHRSANDINRGRDNGVSSDSDEYMVVPMPRYYFNLRDGDEFIPDDEGIEFPAIQGARDEAFRGLADCARDAISNVSGGELVIEVADSRQNVLFVAKLAFATEFLERGDATAASEQPSTYSELSPIRKSRETNGVKHRNLAS